DKRKNLHLTAVFSSNFTNYLYVIAKKLAVEYSIPFEALIPLIELTANRVKEYDPSMVQTGPAARGDINTIQAHLKMLENHSGLQRLYREFSDQILKEFHTRN